MNPKGANQGAGDLPAVSGLAARFRKSRPAAQRAASPGGVPSVRGGVKPAEPKSGYVRSIILVGVLGALAISAFVRLQPEAVATAKKPAAYAGLERLEYALSGVRCAWRPGEHARALAAFAEQADQHADALCRLLRHPEHPLILQALELAGFLRLERALPEVSRLAARPELRIPAVTAADAIAQLPEAELLALLGDSEPAMVVAALAMAQRRDVPPLQAMVDLLAHADERVAAAALQSLPASLPEELRSDLERLTDDSRQAVRTRAHQALLRIGADATVAQDNGGGGDPGEPGKAGPGSEPAPSASPEARSSLIEQLDATDEETRIAALQGLDSIAAPEDGERVAGMLRSVGQEAVKKQACLFLAHVQYRPAVREMIDLMRDTTDAGLKANAHSSLQRITGLKLKQDPELWDQWWEQSGTGFVRGGSR